LTQLLAGTLDEDAAHGFRSGGEEVGAVLEGGSRGPGVGSRGSGVGSCDEAEVGFVNEGGGLECVAGLFLSQFGGGELAKLVVDEGEELLGSRGIAGFDLGEDAGDVGHEGKHKRRVRETPESGARGQRPEARGQRT